jgi:3-ketosteroid 9alpha-monooxygenase subunit A
MYEGWYLVAFESELAGALTPVSVGDVPLVLVAGENGVRAFDAICPHRGANLAYGGRLDGDVIVCPFHGKRIKLGCEPDAPYWAQEYPALGYGGMIFVRLSEGHENGLGAFLDELAARSLFAPCHVVPMEVDGDLVIENAFDDAHFDAVHGVDRPRLAVRSDSEGALVADGTLVVPVSTWQQGEPGRMLSVPFTAHAFSPQLVFSHLGGANPYWVITGTVPVGNGCDIRQALAVPKPNGSGSPPDPERLEYLARASRGGLEQDRVIWEHMRRSKQARFAPDDETVVEFRKFCRRFRPRD